MLVHHAASITIGEQIMHRVCLLVMTLLMVCAYSLAVQAQESSQCEVNGADAEVRASIDSYIAAFNAGDAKAVASHWSPTGKFVTPDGITLQGRAQLESDFSEYFAEAKGAKLELPETKISFISPNVAIETGVARVVASGQVPTETRYEAIHVKTTEGWKVDRISEQQSPDPPPSHHEHLQSLEWMVGTWIDRDENAVVETTCRWTTNKNFLVRTFKVHVDDSIDFEGTQVIGWDPHRSVIRSWLFDSDGGFGVGQWTQDDNRWVVRSLSVLPDGRRGSATQVYEQVDENTLQFRSIGRQVDGEILPNIDSITVSRMQE